MKQIKTSERILNMNFLRVAQATGSIASQNILVNFVMDREEELEARPQPRRARAFTPLAA